MKKGGRILRTVSQLMAASHKAKTASRYQRIVIVMAEREMPVQRVAYIAEPGPWVGCRFLPGLFMDCRVASSKPISCSSVASQPLAS